MNRPARRLTVRSAVTTLLAVACTSASLALAPAALAVTAPTVSLTGPTTAVDGTSMTVHAAVTVTSAPGSYNSRVWTDTRGWVANAGPTSAQIQVPSGDTGSDTITLHVSDEFGGKAQDSLTVTVIASGTVTSPVTLTGPAPQTVPAGTAARLAVTTNRANPQVWWSTPDSSCYLAAGSNPTGAVLTCPVTDLGAVQVDVTVYDLTTGDSASWRTTVTFTSANPAPGSTGPVPVPVATSLTSTYRYGWPGLLVGVLTTPNSTHLGARHVTVQWKPAGTTSWRGVATIYTDPLGTAAWHPKPTTAGTWRLVFAGSPGYAPSTSPGVYVRVLTGLTSHATAGRPDRVTGRLANGAGTGLAAQVIGLQSRTWTGGWVTVTSARTGSTGTVGFSVQPRSWRAYRLVLTKTAALRASTSPTVVLTY